MVPQEGSHGPRRVLARELVRLGWMLFGFNGIVVAGMSIVCYPTWTLRWRDVVFWGTVVGTGLLRHLDIMRFEGETAVLTLKGQAIDFEYVRNFD